MKFSKSSTLAQVLEFGGTEEILAEFNVPCLGCPMAKSEMEHLTIGEICAVYGLNEPELLDKLNALLNKFTKK